MMTLVGGIIALILGFIGLGFWSDSFIILLKGGIPAVLIIGGALATYLGVEEWKDTQSLQETMASSSTAADCERYKEEADRLRAELEAAKEDKAKEESAEEES